MGRGSHHFKGGKFNTIVHFVPHQQAWVIERMGRYRCILEPVKQKGGKI